MAFQVTNPRKFYGLAFIGVIIVCLVGWNIAWGESTIVKTGEFTIESGTSSRQVWRDLVEQEYSSKSLPWKYYSWRQEAADKIQAGTYQLEEGELIKDIMRRFVAGEVLQDELAITFPEGFTLNQIAERTAAKGIGTTEEFITAASNPSQFADTFPYLADLPEGRTLEGYLFPDTYKVFVDDTPEDVILRMLAAFNQKVVVGGLVEQAQATGRTLDEAVIMASIVEREVQTDDDMALVAGVLWARFDDGVGLGADATVRYLLDKPTAPLTVQDLASDSPYNTRRFRGLPPGPISNPGIRALSAAVNPEPSEFYYYLSAPSGETIFGKTLEEHNVNKATHL